MTSSHILFIPGVLMIGMFLGFVLGGRAVRNQIALQDKRDADREAARAKREAERAARKVVASEPEPARTEIETEPSKPVSASAAPKSGKKSGGKANKSA